MSMLNQIVAHSDLMTLYDLISANIDPGYGQLHAGTKLFKNHLFIMELLPKSGNRCKY